MSQITTTAGQQKPNKCLNVKGKIFFHANHSLTIVEQCVGDWPIVPNIKQVDECSLFDALLSFRDQPTSKKNICERTRRIFHVNLAIFLDFMQNILRVLSYVECSWWVIYLIIIWSKSGVNIHSLDLHNTWIDQPLYLYTYTLRMIHLSQV